MYNETFVEALKSERRQPVRARSREPELNVPVPGTLKVAQSVASKLNIKKMEIENFSAPKIEPMVERDWVADVAPLQREPEFVPAPDLDYEEMLLRTSGKKLGDPQQWDLQPQVQRALTTGDKAARFMFSFFVGLYLAMLTVLVGIMAYNGFSTMGMR